MSMLETIAASFFAWIDAVVIGLAALARRIRPVRRICVAEQEDGSFMMSMADPATRGGKRRDAPAARQLQIIGATFNEPLPAEWTKLMRGSEVELMMRSSRFLFRPLELPNRATEFLEGIVRAQIDRLTPWSASDAAFRWTRPRPIAGERIAITIAVAPRSAFDALAQIFADLGAAAVAITTETPDGQRVAVHDAKAAADAARGNRLRVAVLGICAISALATIASSVAATILVDQLGAQERQIHRRIAERRAILRGDVGSPGGSALELLEQRKQNTPASVMVIEALAAVLPDHTYATELRIDGDKVQVAGVTRDAPSLIQLLEQSPSFARAAFFAPTTRAANETGERFHVEARINPYFGTAP
ncbi:general secretion pathway protein L [Rhodopseudomonas thermotolerans]|uniref:General secretion pathway protein L n=2 Tax=Rhodopseudomonas TaxID=1073 RepID=A0A336JRZ7_9BRAD|nr:MULTISPECIES: PilN domain-containing protein [Rhodopseudomonas]RED35169.1 general secretion pathway protein L [Rhodopseudomonas pentothenatexigens]REG03012.1 general secretion pathway protein L [Rhodopseudomonas thermotolerans]SSW90859.1 general secretion pathway protein L [Rhodopseudomonas pentothenatexigens]